VTANQVGSRGRPTSLRHLAMCCACGQLRTVAQTYRGRRPDGADAIEPAGPWCRWLMCAHCATTTVHALIPNPPPDSWRRDGCDRERENRLADQSRRRIQRRLNEFATEGVTIVRAQSADQMHIDDAVIEVMEFDDARGLLLRVCVSIEPDRLLSALERAEDYLDAPSELGPWIEGAAGRWRGLALLSSGH
jgi:hypothetical protein